MATRRGEDRRSLEEAAAWFTRLRQDSVNEATIEDFFAWRRAPANDAAYIEVEARWRQADRVRNDPELVGLTEAALRRETIWVRLRRALRNPIWHVSVATLAFVGAAALMLMFMRPKSYETDVGAQQIVRLEDGSVLRLNTDSQVDVRFSRSERGLILKRGEAFFEVAHDASRPFIVQAGDAQVRAIGTKFDVRHSDAHTQVTLVEGKVQVARPDRGERWTLTPSQQLVLNGAPGAPKVTDVGLATSWTTGRLQFRQTPLVDAVAEVNRYSRTKIRLDARHVEQVRVNGVFDTGDTEAFVSAVTELFNLKAQTTSNGILLRANPGGAAD